jgi:hypothetical protein
MEAKAAAEASSISGFPGESLEASSQYPSSTITNGHQSFAGPSGHHRGQGSVDILGSSNDSMDIDSAPAERREAQPVAQPVAQPAAQPAAQSPPPPPRLYQPMPSTAHMLEKARAASQRADSGPSPVSSINPHAPPPPPSANP